MSMRTQIRGYTAWVNLRLMPYNQLMNNVLMDLLTGTSMKYLVESITGRDMKKLESFDGLSQQQKQTRVEWVVEELKRCNVVPADMHTDSRMFAMRSAYHVFELLWRLISHDIWFIWERLEFLQQDDLETITHVPFKWTPDPPPKKKKKKTKPQKSLLSGFGAGLSLPDPAAEEDRDDGWIKFPSAEFMKNYKKKKRFSGSYPKPDECILEMVNTQLKKTSEGKYLSCLTVDNLVDSRILCALVNSFVPNTFATDLLLNDRWTINLALRTAERMFYSITPFDSEDLVEADPTAVSAYFCFYFMLAFKYRQCEAVVKRIESIQGLVHCCSLELEKFPTVVFTSEELHRRKEIKLEMESHNKEIEKLEHCFDVPYCNQWVQHVAKVQKVVKNQIYDQIRTRFDKLIVPRNVCIGDLCLSYVINLSLTRGSGFYRCETKEIFPEGRGLVLWSKETGNFIDSFTNKNKEMVKEILKVPECLMWEIDPEDFPQYEIYLEATSRNKHLKAGSVFLYQVFPDNFDCWHRMLIKAVKNNDYDMVEKFVSFFRGNASFINCKEPRTGNTPLHWAAKNGYFEMVLFLLESGANINAQNNFKCTPFSVAVAVLHRRICHLLIEWGCDVHGKSVKNQSAFESVKSSEFRQYLMNTYDYYCQFVPKIMNGDMEMMNAVLKQHTQGQKELCCLRSRCINGSTLLHTAAYYNNLTAIKVLLEQNLDVNLRDYRGATSLHRASSCQIMQFLIDAGASINAVDDEGNTALHVRCYGESGKPSDLSSVELLINSGVSLLLPNSRRLLPIHCATMQGQVNVIQQLLQFDSGGMMKEMLNGDKEKYPPSLPHLAVANDFISCAEWLLENGFLFKEKEVYHMLKQILMEHLKLQNSAEAVRFLLRCGADPNARYLGDNSCLHYAATGRTDILELLLSHGAKLDSVNQEGCTPLFLATQAGNKSAACVLINQGANVRHKNMQGLTAFDYIVEFEEWIESGYFTDEIKMRLRAYNLKFARDLIRVISRRVRPTAMQPIYPILHSAPSLATSSPLAWTNSQASMFSGTQVCSSSFLLPSIMR